jgi:hypothetical protein
MKLHEKLRSLDACSEAVEWAKTQKSAKAAWDSCKRGDWMLWIVGRTINCNPWTDGRKPLLACSLDCAETAKRHWPKTHAKKIAAAIAVLRSWIAGEATVEQAKEAKQELWSGVAAAYADAADADAAYASAAYAAAAHAAYAAYAYADAAYGAAYAAAAAHAAYAAYAYADAADAAAYAAAYAAAAAAARAKALAKCADIVRSHFPMPPEA